jgi:hypothetical protein
MNMTGYLLVCHVFKDWDIEFLGWSSLTHQLSLVSVFGYANLNNDDFADWGYIDMQEFIDNGAEKDREWKPCTFEEAIRKVKQDRGERGYIGGW